MSRTLRQRRHRARIKSARRKQIGFALLLTALAVLAGGGYGLYRYLDVQHWPSFNTLKPSQIGQNSVVYAADGSRMGVIQSDENRTIVSFQAMGKWMPKAIVAIEDKRFYDHGGVDYEGIARAAVVDAEHREAQQGASTITQELVRNIYTDQLTDQKTLKRKAKEAYLATQLEKHWSKQQILTEYLNVVFFGNNAYGVEAASQTYFSKHAKNLTLGEAAVIAGLPQAPTNYDPIHDIKAATLRRNDVLKAMYQQHMISATQYQKNVALPIRLHVGKLYSTHRIPYFFDFVEQQLIKQYGAQIIRNGGLAIHTTVDPKLQAMATDAIKSTLDEPGDPEAAMVAIDTKTGEIKAMASSDDYSDTKFNTAADAQRQPGSTAKIWALATMVSEDINPETTYYTSMPINVQLPGSTDTWSPKTDEGTYAGYINVDKATVLSDNTVFAQISMDLGPQNIVNMAHRMGITSHLEPYYSIVLGSEVVSPLEQTNFYSSIARGGVEIDPTAVHSITTLGGGTFKMKKAHPKRVLQDWQAAAIITVLEHNVEYGTGTNANFGWHEAGKTGTTDDEKDAWFCGMTPQLTTCVWMGYRVPKILIVHGQLQQGAYFPAEMWRKFMEPAVQYVSHDNDIDFFTVKGTPTWVPFKSTWQDESVSGITNLGSSRPTDEPGAAPSATTDKDKTKGGTSTTADAGTTTTAGGTAAGGGTAATGATGAAATGGGAAAPVTGGAPAAGAGTAPAAGAAAGTTPAAAAHG